MTTTMSARPATAELREPARPAYRVTGLRVLRSEWGKFWSLRSSWITLGITLLLLVAIGAIASATYSPGATASSGPPGPGSGSPSDAVSLALLGSTFASLAIGALGVLVSAGEYTTGMIRSTLAAVPARLPVLWSKSAVFAAIATPVATAGAIAAFSLGSLGLHGQQIALSLGAVPSNAGQAVMSLHQSASSLSPWAGLAVFAGWVALALAGAAYRLVRTDA